MNLCCIYVLKRGVQIRGLQFKISQSKKVNGIRKNSSNCY